MKLDKESIKEFLHLDRKREESPPKETEHIDTESAVTAPQEEPHLPRPHISWDDGRIEFGAPSSESLSTGYQGYESGAMYTAGQPIDTVLRRTDGDVRQEAIATLESQGLARMEDIIVEVNYGVLHLSGTVDSLRIKLAIANTLEGIPGVQDIQNRLQIRSAIRQAHH